MSLRWLISSAVLACCGDVGSGDHAIYVDLELPDHFPPPQAPTENPLTADSVNLGRHLFYDLRLSVNEQASCASCHKQEFAFADNLAVSVGATGELGVLNSPSLTNAIYANPLTWAHAEITSIEDQLMLPMFGQMPVEMGILGNEQRILDRLRADPRYEALFQRAYPDEDMSLDAARKALASFVRSMLSSRSPFDAFLSGDSAAISPSVERGSELFYSDRLGCSRCHVGFLFASSASFVGAAEQRVSPFHNVGLYNVDGEGAYPDQALGLIAESGIARDMGRFRVPSLRNVGLTAPYGHDGSVATLEEFIRIYEAGGRNIEAGEHRGDGRDNPWRSGELKDFQLSDQERDDLVEFLHSLTDREFTIDARYADPWG